LLESILDAAKAAVKALVLQWEKINLAEFFAELQQSHPVPRDAKIKLQWDFPPDSLPIETDANKLRQILQSLINNAVKFTAEGLITVSARVFESDPEMRDGGELDSAVAPTRPITASSFLELRVTDTGIGIQEKDVPFIFDMFRQVDGSSARPYGGLGLGLYMAGNLTKLLGGTMEVKSELNNGSTFIVRIPIRHAVDSKPSENATGTSEQRSESAKWKSQKAEPPRGKTLAHRVLRCKRKASRNTRSGVATAPFAPSK
jgi:two-component system chemotaxis sensor kinase CheA